MGRFINVDSLISSDQSILGNNLFAYCLNNPVCRNDDLGTTSVDIFDNELDHTDDDKEFGSGNTGNDGSGGSGSDGSSQSTGGTQKSVANGRITGYTQHGLNQATGRDGVGVKPSAILDTVRNPTKVISQSDGRIKYVGRQAVVVVNSTGKIITTYAKSSVYTRTYK